MTMRLGISCVGRCLPYGGWPERRGAPLAAPTPTWTEHCIYLSLTKMHPTEYPKTKMDPSEATAPSAQLAFLAETLRRVQ